MDKDVVGAGFYVMEFLEGRVFQNIFMKEVNDEDRRAWCVSFSSSVLLGSGQWKKSKREG
jgi:aminoglycoside phosphotransferase (APT) family kinase protein